MISNGLTHAVMYLMTKQKFYKGNLLKIKNKNILQNLLCERFQNVPTNLRKRTFKWLNAGKGCTILHPFYKDEVGNGIF